MNPAGIRAQVEGGVQDAIHAARHGEITVEGGAVQQGNSTTTLAIVSGGGPADVAIVISYTDEIDQVYSGTCLLSR